MELHCSDSPSLSFFYRLLFDFSCSLRNCWRVTWGKEISLGWGHANVDRAMQKSHPSPIQSNPSINVFQWRKEKAYIIIRERMGRTQMDGWMDGCLEEERSWGHIVLGFWDERTKPTSVLFAGFYIKSNHQIFLRRWATFAPLPLRAISMHALLACCSGR